MVERTESFPILRKRLDEDGCELTTEEFISVVCETFVQLQKCSDEELLHEPDEAKAYCIEVRKRIGANVADKTILRTLTNTRKRECFPST